MPKQKNVIVGSVGIILWEAADLQISKITFEIALTHGSLYEILEIGILYGKIYIFFLVKQLGQSFCYTVLLR